MDIPALSMSFDANAGGLVTFGSDDKLFVKFKQKSVIDPIKSKELGRPVHVAVDYVHIQQPGERDYIEKPVTQEHLMRFPRQWAAYQNGKQDAPAGTPLAILFPNNPEIVDNLKHFNVQTVEQLAELNDTQKQNIGMGALHFVEKAKQFLASSEKGKGFHELEQKLEAMELRVKALADRNTALEAALADAEAEEDVIPRPRRGRPPKAA